MQHTDQTKPALIDFCIPFVGSGLQYTKFLISNLLSTAAHPERISISLSAHSQSDVDLIKNSSFNHLVKRIVMAPAGGNSSEDKFVIQGVIGSANHCSAVASLLEHTTADIVIFSDYDMVFLVDGWDVNIAGILNDHDLCGVAYPDYLFPLTLEEFPELYGFLAANYQNKPNLSFLAITRKCIGDYFPKGISVFYNYLAEGGIPFQIVNTAQMEEALHLPLGSVWWMDSGWEIPFVIQREKLRYQTFIPMTFDKQTVFSPTVFTDPPSSGNLPDVFIDNISGKPLLAHYGHGTYKSQHFDQNHFDCFMRAANDYLAAQKMKKAN